MATESKGGHGHGGGSTIWGVAVIAVCATVIVLAVLGNLHPERDGGFVPLSGGYAGYQPATRSELQATQADYDLVRQVYR